MYTYFEGCTSKEDYIKKMTDYYSSEYSEGCGYSRKDLIEVMVKNMANLHARIASKDAELKHKNEIIDKLLKR